MTKALSATKVEKVPLDEIPEGEYKGVWGGYEAIVVIEDARYLFTTEDGIRTFDAPATITVSGGEVRIEYG